MEKLKQYWQSIVFIIVIIGVISTLSYSYDLCHGDATISQLQKYSVAAVPFYKLGISAILLVIAFLLLILPNLKDVLMISNGKVRFKLDEKYRLNKVTLGKLSFVVINRRLMMYVDNFSIDLGIIMLYSEKGFLFYKMKMKDFCFCLGNWRFYSSNGKIFYRRER